MPARWWESNQMTIQIETYVLDLAREYLAIIEMMHSGDYHGTELYELSSQRSGVHDELVRVLGDGYERPFDMRRYCQDLVNGS